MSNKILKSVLIINCGSSSLKFAILDANSNEEYLSGLCECVGLEDARIKWHIDGETKKENLPPKIDHKEALQFLLTNIIQVRPELANNIIAVGHRFAHGGEHFTTSILVDDNVIKGLEACRSLAPLHGPAQLIGIKAAKEAFANLPNVVVFDTAFHQTMPRESFLYGLPYELYEKYGIRRYGMHGISHQFIAQECAKRLGKPLNTLNIINCHLGNGASLCAIKNGQCVDTSMGFTPLAGLVMGTRCGDIDPAIIFHMHNVLKMGMDEIAETLTKKSGLLGLTQETSDCRYVAENYETKDNAKRALEVFCHSIVHYIGAYAMELDGRIDALVFTGGIGENNAMIRSRVLDKLSILNFHIDDAANKKACLGGEGTITTKESRVAMVLATNEELIIAQEAMRISELSH